MLASPRAPCSPYFTFPPAFSGVQGTLADLSSKEHESMISGLQKGEETVNRILDINTMMTAFQVGADSNVA